MNERDIYVSSLAMQRLTVEEMIAECHRHGWALEFSSGIPHRSNMEDIYIAAPVKRMLHNYFPAPEIPFVLNLASADPVVRKMSVAHCIRGLQLSKLSQSPFFAAHAGFCIDPSPEQLGNPIKLPEHFDTDVSAGYFLESINDILTVACDLEIDFLIENNVLAKFNYESGRIPFLCCDSKGINWLFKRVKHKHLGLLLDTAHLKISSITLGKNLAEEIENIQSFIRGIHHSDNDGTTDDNLAINGNYWFLPYMAQFSSIPHVIEVRNLTADGIFHQIKLLN